jgi:hypothetical protein
MGAAGPVNPKGRSASGGPEPAGLLQRSGREEPAPEFLPKGAGGEKTWLRRFHQGTAPPIGLSYEQGMTSRQGETAQARIDVTEPMLIGGTCQPTRGTPPRAPAA